jgi:hypothetical protein
MNHKNKSQLPATPRKRRNAHHEDNLQIAISTYLKLQYPTVDFTSEASGGKKSQFEAANSMKKRSRNGLPDLIILHPTEHYHGLMLELKQPKTTIIVKIGEREGQLSQDEHIREQYAVLEDLRNKGYYAEFAVGFDQAQEIIDAYMSNQILPLYHQPTS